MSVYIMSNKDYEDIQYVETNGKCPKCGSGRISIHKGVEFEIEKNLKTGKTLHIDKYGTTTFWIYRCRKCNWISKTCCE